MKPTETRAKSNPENLVYSQRFNPDIFGKASHQNKWAMLKNLFNPNRFVNDLPKKKRMMLQNLIRSQKIMEILHRIMGKIIFQYSKFNSFSHLHPFNCQFFVVDFSYINVRLTKMNVSI